MREYWKNIRGTHGRYEVSNYGKVRRSKSGINTFVGRILKPWETYGYLHVTLDINGKRNHKIASLVAENFIGKRPKGFVVNHKNGLKKDNRLCNLEYISQKENIIHSYIVLGTKPNCIKLNRCDVIRIRYLYNNGITRNDLTKMFNVSFQCISRIINKTTWKPTSKLMMMRNHKKRHGSGSVLKPQKT